jgi:hypothetical protein
MHSLCAILLHFSSKFYRMSILSATHMGVIIKQKSVNRASSIHRHILTIVSWKNNHAKIWFSGSLAF